MKTIIIHILFINLLTIMWLFLAPKFSFNKNEINSIFLIKHVGRVIPVCVSYFYSKIKEEISIVFTPRMRNDIQISLIFFALYRLLTLILGFSSFITLIFLFPFIFNITYYFNVYLYFSFIQKRLQKLVKSNIGIDMLLSNVIYIQLHIEKAPVFAKVLHIGCAFILFFSNIPIVFLSLYILISKKLYYLPNFDSHTTINDFSDYPAQLQADSINTDFRLACIIKDYILIKNCVVDTIKKEKECKKEHKLIKKLIKQLLKKYDYDEYIIGTKNEKLNELIAGTGLIMSLNPKINSTIVQTVHDSSHTKEVLTTPMTAYSKCNFKKQVGLEQKSDIGDHLNKHATFRKLEILPNGEGKATVTSATSYYKGVENNPHYHFHSLKQNYSKLIAGRVTYIEQGISVPFFQARLSQETIPAYKNMVNEIPNSIIKLSLDEMLPPNIPKIYTTRVVIDKDLVNTMSEERLKLYTEMKQIICKEKLKGSYSLQVVINVDIMPGESIPQTLKNIEVMRSVIKKHIFVTGSVQNPKFIEFIALYDRRLALANIEIADMDPKRFTPGRFDLIPMQATGHLKNVCLTNSTAESRQTIIDTFLD